MQCVILYATFADLIWQTNRNCIMAITTLRRLAVGILMLPLVTMAADKPPRLVLQITVDQLRGDLPARYLDNEPADHHATGRR